MGLVCFLVTQTMNLTQEDRVIVSLHWILHTSLASYSLSLAHSLWYNGRPVVELKVVELHYL